MNIPRTMKSLKPCARSVEKRKQPNERTSYNMTPLYTSTFTKQSALCGASDVTTCNNGIGGLNARPRKTATAKNEFTCKTHPESTVKNKLFIFAL